MTPSPCIKICRMDENQGLCQGCFRTLAEIVAWSRAGEDEKKRILTAVARRRQALENRAAPLQNGGHGKAP